MKIIAKNLAILVSTGCLALTGCTGNTPMASAGVGAVAGGVVGGLAGSLIGAGTGQLVAVGAGAVAGTILGGAAGASMDNYDRANACSSMTYNQTNQYSSWKNKRTGRHYTLRTTSNVIAYKGHQTCRRYEMTSYSQGKQETSTGIACQTTKGAWTTVNEA